VNEASGVETAGVSRPLPLRRNKGFRMLWAAATIFDPAAAATMAMAAVLRLILPGLRQTESPATAAR
jgi:hypothetical protein